MALTFTAGGRVQDGKLFITNRRLFDKVIASWPNCPITITVEKAHATRSKAQNAYYHSTVVKLIAEHCGNSPKEMHEILKAQHLPHDLAASGVNGRLLNGLVIGGSTAKLNKLQFIEYLESIVQWAAEELGVVCPDPDPEWRQHAEEEARKAVA